MHRTIRISQKGRSWLEFLKTILHRLGERAWIYREGKDRNVYALETTARFLNLRFDPLTLKTASERISYIRGYFDAEGGIPHSSHARFYIQLCQKNRMELECVRAFLEDMGIRCGIVHNPSAKVDPDYWRFFVRTQSHNDFVRTISTWHPRKKRYLQKRMKI